MATAGRVGSGRRLRQRVLVVLLATIAIIAAGCGATDQAEPAEPASSVPAATSTTKPVVVEPTLPFQPVGTDAVGDLVGPLTEGRPRTHHGDLVFNSPIVYEDAVVNGCVTVRSDDVVLRNVVIRCSGWNAIDNLDDLFINTIPIDGLTIENSRIECLNEDGAYNGKLLRLTNATNVRVANSELVGCDQTFYLNGRVDGFEAVRNVQRDPYITDESHWEVLSLGEEEEQPTVGKLVLRENRFSTDSPVGGTGITDIIFTPMDGGGDAQVELVGNYFPDGNEYTIRCGEFVTCEVAFNVFASSLRESSSIGLGLASQVFRCNYFDDGTLIGFGDGSVAGAEPGVDVDNTDCLQ